jgi:Ca-activated chloride channel family protein
MSERSFESELARLAPPAPDPAARLSAKRAALAEFARVHAHAPEEEGAPRKQNAFKAFLTALRLTRDEQQHGRAPMSISTRNTLFGSVATLSVAVLGVTLMWPTIRRDGGLPTPELPPARNAIEQSVPTQSAPRDVSTSKESAKSQQRELVYIEPAIAEPPPAMLDVPPPDLVVDMPVAPSTMPPATAITQTTMVRPSAMPSASGSEEIIVTGHALALAQSMETKRDAIAVNAISAESIGSFPDRYMAGGRAHIPGAPFSPEDRDKFEHFETSPLTRVADAPFSTFSIDVDTASYSFVRRQLNYGVLPQKDAVRAEEMINYFDYAWPAPESRKQPFKATLIVSDSPWTEGKKLVHIGIKGYELERENRPDANLVLLLDVSGSMNAPDKLPLVKQSMHVLLSSLKPTDTVAIVVYAGAAGKVLEPTPVAEKEKIVRALNQLQAGGSTAGAEGIKLAYQLAESHFRKEGVNRILLATDGDFNVGITDQEQLKDYVQRQRQKGIFLSVLGFGQGNYRDSMAQALAQNGNGVAAYIDTLNEARKVSSQEASASLFTIAKDVKLQVEFNPATVAEYRLIGYETRALRREDFNNDAIDAGDIGAGHTVTAIYEITPVGSPAQALADGRYADEKKEPRSRGKADEYGYLKIRYKLPDSDRSKLLEEGIPLKTRRLAAPLQRDVQFSIAVAGFAQLLRGSTYTGSLSYEDVIEQAQSAKGEDPYGYRAEFVELARKAQSAKEM